MPFVSKAAQNDIITQAPIKTLNNEAMGVGGLSRPISLSPREDRLPPLAMLLVDLWLNISAKLRRSIMAYVYYKY